MDEKKTIVLLPLRWGCTELTTMVYNNIYTQNINVSIHYYSLEIDSWVARRGGTVSANIVASEKRSK